MARLLRATTPMGQIGEKVTKTGLDLGPESGFFGREFTAKDLSDVFTLTQQGVGLIKEAEPIADYFSRKSKEADKQAALKEIADKRAKINAQKAAQVKLQRELGQQTAENRRLMDAMPAVPDVTLQEPTLGSSLAEPKPFSLRETPNIIENQISDDFLTLKNQGYDDVTASLISSAGRDTQYLPRPQTPMQLNVDMPGAVDPSAMLQDMKAQRQPVATERQPAQQERLVQAARQRVGAGPRGSQRLADGTYRDPLDPNLVAAYESLEESTGLPLRQMYEGSMPRYTPGTPDPVFPSEEALERLDARDLNTYRNLVRTPQEAALFNRLMDKAIKREGSGFMKEFTTQDALRKELFKPFDFAAGKKPRKLDSGALKLDEIRKARKDFFKQNKRKGLKVKGRVKIPKAAENLIENGVITIERGTYKDGDDVVTSENGVTSKAYAGYLELLRSQSQSRSTINASKIAIAGRSEEGRRAVMDSLGIDGLDAADKPASMKAIKRRLAIWATVTDKQVNAAKKDVRLSVGAKPGTIIRGTQGDKRIGQGGKRIAQGDKRLAQGDRKLDQGDRRLAQGDKRIDQGQQRIDERIRSNKVNEELRERGVTNRELNTASQIADRLDRAEGRKDQLKIRQGLLLIAQEKQRLAREGHNRSVQDAIMRNSIRAATQAVKGVDDEQLGERFASELEKQVENNKRRFISARTNQNIPPVETDKSGRTTSTVRVLRGKADTGRK